MARDREGAGIGDLFSGHTLKEAGQQQVELNAKEWVEAARVFAMDWADDHGSVTSDIVHKHLPPPADAHPNAMGAVFRTGFVRIGYTTTTRSSGHARMISVWKTKNCVDSPSR
jgi:hypothetical protein